jgi:hypothetical protein
MTPAIVLSKGHVFPLSSARKPLIKWREGSRQGTASFPNHKGFFGLDCSKSQLVVIDVDHKDGAAPGLANLHLLGDLPKTYTVKTRTGGLHLYFRNKGAPVPNSASKIAPSIDARGDGGFVVIYEDVVCDAPIAPLPDHLRALCGESPRVEPSSALSLIEVDQAKNIHAAIEYLRTAEPAREGEAGDAHTLKVAMRLKDMGVSEETAFEIMLGEWNDHCEPPWDSDELERKVHNAFEYGRNAVGSATREHAILVSEIAAEDVFGPAPAKVQDDEPVEEEEEESIPVRASEIDIDDVPEREWLIEGVYPRRCVSSLYGEGGAGKSLVAMELIMCVAGKIDFYGMKVQHPCPALYVSCEDDLAEMKHRLRPIRNKEAHRANAGKEDNVHLWDRVGRDSLLSIMTNNGRVQQKFLRELDKRLALLANEGDERFFILDTLSDVAAMNENDRSHVAHFLKYILGGLCIKHNATCLILAHPSKSSDYSGSTAFKGSVRAQTFLKRHESDPDMRWLTVGKANRARQTSEGEGGILLRWVDGAFVEQDIDQFERDLKDMQVRSVWNYLSENHGIKVKGQAKNPLKSHSIKDENGCVMPFERVKFLVNEMIGDGRLIEDEKEGLMAMNFEEKG